MKLKFALIALLVLGWASPTQATDVTAPEAPVVVADVQAPAPEAVKAEEPVVAPAPEAVKAEVVPAIETPAPEAAKAETTPAPAPAPEVKAEEKAVVVPVPEVKAAEVPVKDGEVKPPVTDEEAGKTLGTTIDLAKHGAWTAVIGFILMLLVWFARRIGLLNMIPPKVVPLTTLILGCVTAVGLVLAGDQSWTQGFMNGGGGALLATALWENGFKFILGKPPVKKTDSPS